MPQIDNPVALCLGNILNWSEVMSQDTVQGCETGFEPISSTVQRPWTVKIGILWRKTSVQMMLFLVFFWVDRGWGRRGNRNVFYFRYTFCCDTIEKYIYVVKKRITVDFFSCLHFFAAGWQNVNKLFVAYKNLFLWNRFYESSCFLGWLKHHLWLEN